MWLSSTSDRHVMEVGYRTSEQPYSKFQHGEWTVHFLIMKQRCVYCIFSPFEPYADTYMSAMAQYRPILANRYIALDPICDYEYEVQSPISRTFLDPCACNISMSAFPISQLLSDAPSESARISVRGSLQLLPVTKMKLGLSFLCSPKFQVSGEITKAQVQNCVNLRCYYSQTMKLGMLTHLCFLLMCTLGAVFCLVFDLFVY